MAEDNASDEVPWQIDAANEILKGRSCTAIRSDGRMCGNPCRVHWHVPLCAYHVDFVEHLILDEDKKRRLAAPITTSFDSVFDGSAGFVYYAQRPDGAIKIGKARNVTERIATLRIAIPVTLLATHPGGRPAERSMHKRFGHLRLDGEWFRPEPDLLAHIERVKARTRCPVDDSLSHPTLPPTIPLAN